MYSPKISEKLIPKLYLIKQQLNKPMTKVVDDIIEQHIETYYEDLNRSYEEAVCESCLKQIEVDDNQTEAFCESCEANVFVKRRNI